MSLDYIRKTYGVPAKKGARVEYTGGKAPQFGTICGAGTMAASGLSADCRQ
jgi:hypothetical protein